jgi:hypothetical protein
MRPSRLMVARICSLPGLMANGTWAGGFVGGRATPVRPRVSQG